MPPAEPDLVQPGRWVACVAMMLPCSHSKLAVFAGKMIAQMRDALPSPCPLNDRRGRLRLWPLPGQDAGKQLPGSGA